MTKTIRNLLLASAAFVAAPAALATPSLLVTTADAGKDNVLVSIDLVADPAQPVATAVVQLGLKDGVKIPEAALKGCRGGEKAGGFFADCSAASGDLIMLLDGSAASQPLASGLLATFVLPRGALELDAQGQVKVVRAPLTTPDGVDIQPQIVSEAPAEGREKAGDR